MIEQYIKAIDQESAKTGNYLEIKVHQGYKATLERYLKNNSLLTDEQLWSILSLYDRDLKEVSEVQYDGVLIHYIPAATVTLKGVVQTILITRVGTPDITITHGTTLVIAKTGIPDVKIFTPTRIEHVPVPDIENKLQGSAIRIAHLPVADITKIFTTVISHVPYAMIQNTPNDTPTTLQFYYGFTPLNTNSRQWHVDHVTVENITNMLNATDHRTEGHLLYKTPESESMLSIQNWDKNIDAGENAYNLILTPTALGQLTRWETPMGRGNIGGTLDEGITGNMFPAPDKTITYNNTEYYVYLSNRKRRHQDTDLII